MKPYQAAPRRKIRAGVEDRWTKADGSPSARHGDGLRWQARWVDDRGNERSQSFRTKAEAEQHRRDIVTSQETGTYVDPSCGRITLASFYREWSTRQVWVRGTRLGMDRAIAQATFGDVPLTELRRSHFEQWVKSMVDRGPVPSTIDNYYTMVRSVIGAALREQLLARDVGDRVKLPRQPKAKDTMRLPTPEAVKALRAAVPPEFEAFVSLCAFVGLRRGEASALKVSDIDFFGKQIHVVRQVQGTCAANLEIVPPKYGSVRSVDVSDELLAMMSEHIRLFCPGDDLDRWMFASRISQGARVRRAPKLYLPLHGSAVDYMWRNARKAAGVDYRLHDLRHFFASGLIRAGAQAPEVKEAIGHASIETTYNTYMHLWPDSSERIREGVAAIVAWTLG
jgi:integrase